MSSGERFGYTAKVIEHFTNPRNSGKIEDADAATRVGSASCGDMVQLYLKVNPKNDIIEDVKFESYGCAANIASSSVTTEMAKGKSLDEARNISFKDVLGELGGLPKHKIHCAQLSTAGLHAAIMKYEAKAGKIEIDIPFIRKMLTGVLDPVKGVHVIAAKRIEDIEIIGDDVTITLPEDLDEEIGRIIAEDMVAVLDGLDLKVSVRTPSTTII
jgi:NifU-like protein involved in Fe-S cluster formation